MNANGVGNHVIDRPPAESREVSEVKSLETRRSNGQGDLLKRSVWEQGNAQFPDTTQEILQGSMEKDHNGSQKIEFLDGSAPLPRPNWP